MLSLYNTHIISGLTVYEDDRDPTKFYVMPDQPQFRIDPKTNKAVLKFIKYLMPVNRPDGSIGGGFLIFDSVFVLSAANQSAIQSALNGLLKTRGLKDKTGAAQTASLSLPTFTKGTASLTLLDSGGALVTKIEDIGKPSLLGSLVCSFTAELSPAGAAVVQGAMTGSGGVVQVAYDLTYAAVLPPITGRVWFNATQFQSYYKSIQKSGSNVWHGDNTEDEKLRQTFMNSQSGGVSFDFSGLDNSDPNAAKIESDITNWGWTQVANAAKMVAPPDAATPPSGGTNGGGDAGGGGGTPAGGAQTVPGAPLGQDGTDDGMEHTIHDESTVASYSFNQILTQKQSIDYETVQQGTLPNLPNFADYSVQINANDPFFAQIHASVQVNADFAKFNITSVDVNLQYTKSNPPTSAGFHFTKPDDVMKFDSDTVNGDMHYSGNFTVNYQDQSQPYTALIPLTENAVNTISVSTLGIFYVDVTIGNVDFTKTPQIQVSINYPDNDASGQPISRQLTFNQSQTSASLVVVILKPVTQPYTYKVTYIMADGTQVVTGWQSTSSPELSINTPFSSQVVSFISEGDFTNNISNIFLKMTYNDPSNKYQQTSDYTFTSQNRTHDWTFPVLGSGQGTVTYSGVVSYLNNTTQNIPPTTTTSIGLITFGPPNQAMVTVSPDPALIDFTQVKLIQVNFEYTDPTNNIDSKQEIVLKAGSIMPASWTFYAKDPTKTSYTYQATYYLATTPPTIKQTPMTTSSATDLVLLLPS